MNTLGKVVAGVVLGPIILIVVGIGGCEATKAYFDSRIREMCERDGGAKVFEVAKVKLETFERMKGQSGAILIPHESAHRLSVPIFWRSEEQLIRGGHLKISRTEIKFIRRSDGATLGLATYYGRSGGDFPFTVSEPSHFRCPQRTDIEQKILVLEGETQ